jgi:contact-dependent growth inhibition (CDI) system CdiI-like immunity protein
VSGPNPADFPELRRVLAAYLHEDFAEVHGTPAAALRAFHDDASVAERKRFAEEAGRFLDGTSDLSLDEVRTLLARLGSKWVPPSKEALRRLLHSYS